MSKTNHGGATGVHLAAALVVASAVHAVHAGHAAPATHANLSLKGSGFATPLKTVSSPLNASSVTWTTMTPVIVPSS